MDRQHLRDDLIAGLDFAHGSGSRCEINDASLTTLPSGSTARTVTRPVHARQVPGHDNAGRPGNATATA